MKVRNESDGWGVVVERDSDSMILVEPVNASGEAEDGVYLDRETAIELASKLLKAVLR